MKRVVFLLAFVIQSGKGMDTFMQKKIESFNQDDLEQERLTAKLEYHTMALQASMDKLKRNYEIETMIKTIIEGVRQKENWSAQEVEKFFTTLLVPKYPEATIEENISYFMNYNEQTDVFLNDGEHWYTS